MNCIRLIFSGADNNGISIKSTIAKSERLSSKEDELIDFDDQDVVVIRNERCDPTIIRFCEFDPRRGAAQFALLTTSRYSSTKRIAAKDAGGAATVDIILEGNEAVVLKSALWRSPHGVGRTGAPE